MSKPEEVKEQSPEETGSITVTGAQKEFLIPLITKYNEKVGAMVRAHQEVAEISSTIYEFSTKIVADKHKGQWFAIQPELVVRRDHPLAQQLQPIVWPEEE